MAEAEVSSRESRWSLKGMTALVTGGTRGIGFAIVEELAGFGAAVHTCSRNETKLDECIKEWERKGFRVTGSVCDVSCQTQRDELIEKVSSTFQGKLNILEMFGAGSETTSTLLEWSMSEMLKNPRVMKKAQEEVRQVFSDSENVDEAGLQNLKFLKLIIKETLRLHPPISLIPRECSRTCEIDGHVIQAKSKVIINAWAIGRDSNSWTEAEKFYPERFQDSSVDYKGTNFEFIPFGAGKRMCPGMLFGIGNAELLLARLLYHFDWKLPNGEALEDLDMNEAFGGTVTKKHHLNLIPIPHAPCPLPVE